MSITRIEDEIVLLDERRNPDVIGGDGGALNPKLLFPQLRIDTVHFFERLVAFAVRNPAPDQIIQIVVHNGLVRQALPLVERLQSDAVEAGAVLNRGFSKAPVGAIRNIANRVLKGLCFHDACMIRIQCLHVKPITY
jgi:hypothetical protein